MAFLKVATLDELPPGTLLEVVRGDDLVAVCNVDGEVRATSGVCPHSGGPLAQGVLDGGSITCPWHMWPFDSKTGACDFNPDLCIPVYEVRMEGNDILVDMP